MQNLLKICYRIFKYKAELPKQIRETRIRFHQNHAIKQFDQGTEVLILFLIPGADYATGKDPVTGGLLSIISIYNETKMLFDNVGIVTLCSTYYSDHLLFKLSSFDNNVDVYRPNVIEKHFKKVKKLIMHIPDLYVENFTENEVQKRWLNNIDEVQINILNQNINLMPKPSVIEKLKLTFPNITMTTAHQKYCTQTFRKQFNVPLHLLSTFASPDQYAFVDYNNKEDLIVFSPDDENKNNAIIDCIRKNLPNYEARVIKNLKYEDYKTLISKAKFCFTFGEGLDFYFVESVFSGAISFAVYNEDFFTIDFKDLETVYATYDDMIDYIVNDIERLNANKLAYSQYQQKQYNLCKKQYKSDVYRENIRKFYHGDYSFK